MKKSTTITYNIENNGDVSMSEIEYKDYVKNEKGEENLLHYKVKNVKNNNIIKAITDDASSTENIAESNISETFNKIYKVDDTIDETVGVSSNNDDWKIHEYKNHKLDKEYRQEYDTIKFDIKNDILENYGKNSYIKDK
jgi:TusA-related sulfurtransferase